MTQCLQCGTDNPAGGSFCENCGRPLLAATGAGLQTLGNLNTIGGEQTLHRNFYPKDEVPMLAAGAIFAGRYTIESTIGTGGMGVVYRAKDRIGDRDVALKLIRSDRLGGEAAVGKLISEGVVTQDIRHRNVVAVYHVDQADGLPFIAMEFVDGVSLREWHRAQVNARTDVPTKVAARIVREVLDGLEAAHEMGVVHRDLKPENIMLTAEPGEDAAPLKILDFGIARAAGKAVESGTGTSLGTPRYMAPEQITNPDSAGPSADLYSLSTIFYEMLVDVLPQGGWQPPSSGRSDVPAGIDALIQSGLQNRPASRPQSVADYRAKLDAAIGRMPTIRHIEKDEGAGGRTGQGGGVRTWLKIGGGIFAGLVVLGAIGNMVGGDEGGEWAGGQIGENLLSDGEEPPPVSHLVDGDTPRPPVQAGPNYGLLGGRWLDASGAYVDVTMARDGQFSGNGMAADGTGFSMNGRFNGLSANYTVSAGGVSLPGQAAWDGRDCHLNFRTFMPDGQINMQGQFHVDHQPGAPCPAR